jgi:GH15 family glucan-1,4-alpha-glucosidase
VDSPRIADHALIGDCRAAALVSRHGAIDWLCLPHFSSPSVFGALLDRKAGGHFTIHPAAGTAGRQRYVDATNVLQTTFDAPAGEVRITDYMPMPPGSHRLQPTREIRRIVECLRGTLPLRIELDPRPDYGRDLARATARGRRCWAWEWGDEILMLFADAPMALRLEEGRLVGEVAVSAGDRIVFALCHSKREIAILPALGAHTGQQLRATQDWWTAWSGRCRYEGPYRAAVLRSALALKLLTHALSGSVVAAPTTSLPESPGGVRNWDYRYCWLRDAALTMRAFTGLGYMDEAMAFLAWLLHTTRLTAPELGVVYDIYGRPDLEEAEHGAWSGYAQSRPVRIGNAARDQLQLDAYGSVISAARNFAESGGALASDEARFLSRLGKQVRARWQEPDSGIWEIRGPRRQHTFSKVMCWKALDDLLWLAGRGLVDIHVDEARALREEIAATIEARCYNAGVGSYTATLDGDACDASLLLMACLGYADAGGPRMRGTFARIHEQLACNGLLYRYAPDYDGLPGREGAFGLCSFWAIDNLAARGELAEAEARFRHVAGFANDVGLLSEEIDPADGTLLGNFPQAFTHVGLINAALAIEHARAAPRAAA